MLDRLHSGQRPYKCQECGKEFRHRSYFKAHVQAHQRLARNKKKLPIKDGETAEEAKRELNVTLAEPLLHSDATLSHKLQGNAKNSTRQLRPFKCPKCNAAFKKSAHLKQHARTHTGIKAFTCPTCLRYIMNLVL